MPPVAVDEFQDALGELAVRTGEAADTLLSRISVLSPAEARAFITDAYPALLAPYLAASSDLTVQWYAEQPAAERRPGAAVFTPVAAPMRSGEQLAISGRWALSTAAPATALRGNATRQVMNQSRDTVIVNAEREGVRWIRKAKPNACGFCKMLATRAAKDLSQYSYKSEGVRRKLDRFGNPTGDYTLTVIGKRGRTRGKRKLGSEYHDHCRCTAVPIRDGRYEPPDYVQQWTEEYDAIVKEHGTGDLLKISNLMDAGRVRPDRIKLPVTPVVAQPVTQSADLPATAGQQTAPQNEALSQAPIVDLDRPANDPLPELEFKDSATRTLERNLERRAGRKAAALRDAKAVNPGWTPDPKGPNRNNCSHCVNAYALRRKGYDVEATPAKGGVGRTMDDILSRWDTPDGKPRRAQIFNSKAVVDKTVEEVWPEGAYGWVTVQWKTGQHHIFAVEKINGKAVYLEPQVPDAKRAGMRSETAEYHFDNTKASPGSGLPGFQSGQTIELVRVDDLIPTARIIDPENALVRSRSVGEAERAEEAAKLEAKRLADEAEAARLIPLTPEPEQIIAAAKSAGFTDDARGQAFTLGVMNARNMTARQITSEQKKLPSVFEIAAHQTGVDWYTQQWLAARK